MPQVQELARRRLVEWRSSFEPTFTGPRDMPGGLSIRDDRRPVIARALAVLESKQPFPQRRWIDSESVTRIFKGH